MNNDTAVEHAMNHEMISNIDILMKRRIVPLPTGSKILIDDEWEHHYENTISKEAAEDILSIIYGDNVQIASEEINNFIPNDDCGRKFISRLISEEFERMHNLQKG